MILQPAKGLTFSLISSITKLYWCRSHTMPGFFRSLFKTSKLRNRKPQSPPGPAKINYDPPAPAPNIAEEDIQALANRLRDRLSTRGASSGSNGDETHRKGRDGNEAVDRLLDLLVEDKRNPIDDIQSPRPKEVQNHVKRPENLKAISRKDPGSTSSPDIKSPASSRSSPPVTSSESEAEADFQQVGARRAGSKLRHRWHPHTPTYSSSYSGSHTPSEGFRSLVGGPRARDMGVQGQSDDSICALAGVTTRATGDGG